MNTDELAIVGFFLTIVVVALGVPLVRGWAKRQERMSALPPKDPARDGRMARIEHAVEAIAVEVERISEGQRFVTRLLAERQLPDAAAGARVGAGVDVGVAARKTLPHEPDESPR